MRAVYRFIGSRWFILPLVSLPFFYILWLFWDGGGLVAVQTKEKEPVEGSQVIEETSESVEEEEEFDLSLFTVSEEEFQAATGEVEEGSEEAVEALEVVNLHEVLTDETGKYAILYFVWVLSLTPLKSLFRRSKFVSALNRHRRTIGLACFFYATLHLGVYLTNGWKTLVSDISRLYIIAGLIAYAVLFVLSVTSNNWSQRKLGGRKWKRLHRVSYLVIPVLFYHQAFAGKYSWESLRETLFWFSPLIILQPLRIYQQWKLNKEKAAKKAHA
jgi:sulfoxide reductase heme-binding subunit YedZ